MPINHRNLCCLVAALASLPAIVQAQPIAHYCPGSEGLLGPSVPPPGWYVRDYNMFYTADQLNDPSGHSAGPGNFNVFTYAQVPRIIWVTDQKFLGADVGVNALIPLVYQNVTAGPYRSSTFGVGDLLLDGFLAWHPKQFDFVLGTGLWLPTGDSAAPPTTDAGQGYWGGMISLGGTWYVDQAKTWAISGFNRYELNSEQRDTHITPGNADTFEWGIAKRFMDNKFEVGPVGYIQYKTTADSGPGATTQRNLVAAVGPEIGGLIPKIEVQATLSYYYEFVADNRAQGQTIALTFSKRF